MPEFTNSTTADHYLSPDDCATIYDLTPLYSAGCECTGQKIVIAGRSTIGLSDVEQFPAAFGLRVNDPQLVLVPGAKTREAPTRKSSTKPTSMWSGRVAARNAAVI